MVSKHASQKSERVTARQSRSPAGLVRIALRLVLVACTWAAAASGTQLAFGDAIGQPAQERQEQFERDLKARGTQSVDPEPREHTHDDAIEPWELVGV